MNGLIAIVLMFALHQPEPNGMCSSGGKPIIRSDCHVVSAPAHDKVIHPDSGKPVIRN